MASKQDAGARGAGAAPGAGAVLEFLRKLKHPLKAEVEELRRIILKAHPGIGEGIKWNAPSFHLADHFVTFNLHAKDSVRLIFHMGAKPRSDLKSLKPVADPTGLTTRLADDRCIASFRSMDEVKARRPALTAFVKAWIRRLDGKGNA